MPNKLYSKHSCTDFNKSVEIETILINNLIKKYIGCQLDSVSLIKILILTFKAYYKSAPQCIFDLIILKYNRAVPSNHSSALVRIIKLKHYGERSFSYAAPVE